MLHHFISIGEYGGRNTTRNIGRLYDGRRASYEALADPRRGRCARTLKLIPFHATHPYPDALAQKKEKDNDEKQLRKVSKKMHYFVAAKREARARATAPTSTPQTLRVDQQITQEALQNLQLELEAFLIHMEKLELTLLAERRQAEEYGVMRQRIGSSYPPRVFP